MNIDIRRDPEERYRNGTGRPPAYLEAFLERNVRIVNRGKPALPTYNEVKSRMNGGVPMPLYRNRDPQCPSGLFWTVSPGDTLYSIAAATGVELSDILALNPGIDPTNLRPGQRVCLPETAALPRGPIPPCPTGFYWVIAPGDTLHSISILLGTTVEEILSLNPGLAPSNRQIGSSICVPAPR